MNLKECERKRSYCAGVCLQGLTKTTKRIRIAQGRPTFLEAGSRAARVKITITGITVA